MAEYKVKAPDGKIYTVNAPENATDEQLFRFVKSQMASTSPEPETDAPDGVLDSTYNAFRRGLGYAGNALRSAQAENLAGLADQRRQREERRAAGELTLMDRFDDLTTFGSETPEEIESAAAKIARNAQLNQDETMAAFPESEGSGRLKQRAAGIGDAYAEGDYRGMLRGLGEVVLNPGDTAAGAAQLAAEQIPTIAAAGVVTAATKNPVAGLSLFGASSFGQERFGQLLGEAQKYGYDLRDEDQALSAIQDTEFMERQAQRGLTRAAIIASIDMFTGGLAMRSALTLKDVGKNVGYQIGGGTTGEGLAEFADTGTINPGDMLLEGLAEGVTAPADVAALGLGRNSETKLDPDAASAQTADELALLAQQEAEQQEANDLAVAQEQSRKEMLQRNVDFFPAREDYVAERKKARVADLDDTTSELHATYRQWKMENNLLLRTGSKEDNAAKKRFLKETTPENETEQLHAEHEQALEAFAVEREATFANVEVPTLQLGEEGATAALEAAVADLKANELPSPIDISKADGRRKAPTGSEKLDLAASASSPIIPPSASTAAMEAQVQGELPSPLVMGEDGQMQAGPLVPQLSPEITRAVEAARLKEAGKAPKVKAAVSESSKPAPLAAPEADPAAMKVYSQKTATAKVEALAAAKALPDDWSSAFPELDSALNAAKFKIKPFNAALNVALTVSAVSADPTTDTAVNPQAAPKVTEPPVNTLAEEGTTEGAAPAITDPKALKLSEAQTRINKVLDDHFTGDKQNEIDEVYAGGEFLTENIAKLAGVKSKQHVATSIDRFKTKFLEAQGLLKPRASKAEKDAAVAAYGERLRQEADEARQAKITASQAAATEEEAVEVAVPQTADTADTVDMDPNSAANLGDVSDDGEGASSIFAEVGIDSTVASVGQNNYTGVDPEDKAFTQSQTTTDEEVAAQAAERNKGLDAEVESRKAILSGVWGSMTTPDTPSFDFLDANARREVFFVVRQYLENVKILKDPEAARNTLTTEFDDIIQNLPKQESVTDETTPDETTPDAEPRRVAEVSGGVRQISAPPTTGNAAERGSDVAPSEEAAGDAGQQTFTGKLNLVHGFKPPNYDMFEGQQGEVAPPKFTTNENFKGERYDSDGGAYGAEGVYLENPSEPLFFNTNNMDASFFAPATAQVSANFENAFILEPGTVSSMAEITGVDPTNSLAGPDIVKSLKAKGYDGLIVRGFKQTESYDPNNETTDGLHDDLNHPQIIHFKPETLKTTKVFPKSLQEDPSQADQIPANPPIGSAAAPNVSTRTQTKLMPKSFKTGTEFVADVYHGTDTDIQEFDASKLGENTGAGSAKEAFFFAGRGDTASGYAMVQSEKQKESRLDKLRLAAKKFLKGDTLNAQDQQQLDLMLTQSKDLKGGEQFVKDLVAQAKKNPGLATTLSRTFASKLQPGARPNVQMQRIRMKNPLVKDYKGARFRDETYVSLIKKAKANGHDGVVLLNTYDVAGKTKAELTEADLDNIFAVFDTDNITNTFKVRTDPTSFPSRATTTRAARDTFASETLDPMYFGFDTVEQGLDYIIRTGNKFEKQLSKRLKEIAALGDYAYVVVDPTKPADTLKQKDFEPADPRISSQERRTLGARNLQFALDEWTTSIDPPHGLYVSFGAKDVDQANGVVMLNGASDNGLTNSTFLHEMLHAVTQQTIDRVRDGNLTSGPAYQLYKEIEALTQAVDRKSQGITAEQLAKMLNVSDDMAQSMKWINDEAVKLNVHEFIAYAFTDSQFQAFLNTLEVSSGKAKPASVWRRFVNAVQSFMGTALGFTSPKGETALERVMTLTDAMLDERVVMQANQVAQRRGVAPNMSATMNPKIKKQQGDWAAKFMGPKAKPFLDNASFVVKAGTRSLKFLHQTVEENREKIPAVGRWYDAMLAAEATRNEIRRQFEDIALRATQLEPARMDAVNDFIGKSTFFQKWGYDPEIDGKTVKVDPIMKRAFDSLSESEQQLAKDVFAHGETMRQRKIAIAKELGVSGKFFTEAALDGPYAPLKRFGNFAGELKSQQLVDAEDKRDALDPKAVTKELRDKINKLKSDPDHYMISFFDTPGAAGQFVDANKNKYAFAQASERDASMEEDRMGNPAVYEKVLGALKADDKAKIDPEAKKAFQDMVKNLYFQSLDERSARLSGARRMSRAGYDKNMMRSFLSHARAEASLISQMENGTEVNTAFAEVAQQVSKNRPELGSTGKMIVRHYKDTLNQVETPIQDRIAAANSVYMLTTSIGYHVTNATQPIMVTVPRIAGDFNNYTGTWSSLFKGYGVARKIIDGSFFNQVKTAATVGMLGDNQVGIDVSKAPPEYRKLLEYLQLHQLLDVGMEEDLGMLDKFDTGNDALNKASDFLGGITHRLYQVARYVEAHNRISSAIAAYDMASKNRGAVSRMKMTPMEYATSVVQDTQGNFSRLDAPLLLKALPKVMVQYRKYQFLMAWHYTNAFNQGYFGETPEVKAAGKRVLRYSIAHAALGAGATGVPLLGSLYWALTTMLGDEDEPEDLERYIRSKVDDEKLADVLTRGLPAFLGVDMSTKLSQGKIFQPLPYVDFEASDSGAKDVFFGTFAGPAGTTGVNFFRAAGYMKQGDMLKAVEYSVPKGVRSVTETFRLATEGYSLKNGDIVIDPRDINMGSLLINAMGLPSTEINKIKWTRGQQFELMEYFNNESSRMRREYVDARRDRDRAKQKSLRAEWRELQASKDRIRPFFNNERGTLKRQPVSDLMKASRRQSKREDKSRKQLTGN